MARGESCQGDSAQCDGLGGQGGDVSNFTQGSSGSDIPLPKEGSSSNAALIAALAMYALPACLFMTPQEIMRDALFCAVFFLPGRPSLKLPLWASLVCLNPEAVFLSPLLPSGCCWSALAVGLPAAAVGYVHPQTHLAMTGVWWYFSISIFDTFETFFFFVQIVLQAVSVASVGLSDRGTDPALLLGLLTVFSVKQVATDWTLLVAVVVYRLCASALQRAPDNSGVAGPETGAQLSSEIGKELIADDVAVENQLNADINQVSGPGQPQTTLDTITKSTPAIRPTPPVTPTFYSILPIVGIYALPLLPALQTLWLSGAGGNANHYYASTILFNFVAAFMILGQLSDDREAKIMRSLPKETKWTVTQ